MSLVLKKAEEKQQSSMIAKERLYLTADKRRVVSTGPDAALLFATPGQQIPEQFEPLVQAYMADKAKPKPKPEPQPDKAMDTLTTGPPDDDVIENRETRVPKVLRKRGRPPKPKDEN